MVFEAFYQLYCLKKKLKSKIIRKNIFLLGSAPCPNLELYDDDMEIFSVNASARNANILGLKPPIISIIDNELIDASVNYSKPSRAIVIKDGLLNGIDMGNVLSVQSYDAKWGDLSQLSANHLDFFRLNRYAKSWIVAITTKTTKFGVGVEHLYSTGAFAMALSFYLGCNSLTISGFTLYVGQNNSKNKLYFYEFPGDSLKKNEVKDSNHINTRSHTMADLHLVTSLVISGRKIFTKENDFLPAINNWGNPKL